MMRSHCIPQTKTYGYSVQKRALKVVVYDTHSSLPPSELNTQKLLVIGGIHGDEPEGVDLSKALEVSLQQALRKDGDCPWQWVGFVHEANPDGLHQNTRVNAQGTDLNRNYPTQNWQAEATESHFPPGPFPASEPETRGLLRLITLVKPSHILTLHAPLYCVNYDGPPLLAKPWANTMAEVLQYPLEASIGYPTPGSFGTYWGVERHIPVITLELPPQNPHPHAPIHAPSWDMSHRAKVLEALQTLLWQSPSPSHRLKS
ncbi:MAG: M14 family zinc carboxypeptidase [Vampirovibrionales bacterium]